MDEKIKEVTIEKVKEEIVSKMNEDDDTSKKKEDLQTDLDKIMQIGEAESENKIEPPTIMNMEGPGLGFVKIKQEVLDPEEEQLYSENKDLLHNTFQGFANEANLKSKFLGFDECTEKLLYPRVDKQSMILFDIVQELELSEIRAITNLLHAHPEPTVPISRKLLPMKSGSQIRLKILRMPTAELNDDDDDRSSNALKKPLELGWKREIHLEPKQYKSDVIYFAPDGTVVSSLKEVALYLKKVSCSDLCLEDFSFFAEPIGMKDVKKEVIILPKKIGKVRKPIQPSPKRIAHVKPSVVKPSSARRSIQPPKRYATGETSFHPEKKSRVTPRVEPEKAMTMGMLPPKYPKHTERQLVGPMGTSPIEDIAAARRRGRPPKVRPIPIAPKPGITGMPEEEEGDGLFQISALQFSNSFLGSLEEPVQQEPSPPRSIQMTPRQGTQFKPPPNLYRRPSQSAAPQIPMHTSLQSDDEQLLPCSIRCVGMTGEVPTLQCKLCLCLYHPECIGLPPNLNFVHFICSFLGETEKASHPGIIT